MQFVTTPKTQLSQDDQNLKLLAQSFIAFVQELWIKFKQMIDPPDGKLDLSKIRSEVLKGKSPISSLRNLNEDQQPNKNVSQDKISLNDSKNSLNENKNNPMEIKTPTGGFRFQQRISQKDLNTSEDKFTLPETKENDSKQDKKPYLCGLMTKQHSMNERQGKVEYQRVEEEDQMNEKDSQIEFQGKEKKEVKLVEITQNLYQQFQQNDCQIEILLKMNKQNSKEPQKQQTFTRRIDFRRRNTENFQQYLC